MRWIFKGSLLDRGIKMNGEILSRVIGVGLGVTISFTVICILKDLFHI